MTIFKVDPDPDFRFLCEHGARCQSTQWLTWDSTFLPVWLSSPIENKQIFKVLNRWHGNLFLENYPAFKVSTYHWTAMAFHTSAYSLQQNIYIHVPVIFISHIDQDFISTKKSRLVKSIILTEFYKRNNWFVSGLLYQKDFYTVILWHSLLCSALNDSLWP